MKRAIAVLLFLLIQPGWATVYYVRPTNGDNGNAGTSFATAWQTTQYALDNSTGGDEIRLCAEAVETPTATIDIDGTYSSSTPIYITGANGTDGSVDGTVYTISGSTLGAEDDLVQLGGDSADYGHIRYIRFTAATRYNFYYSSQVYGWSIQDCRFDNATSHGLYSIAAGSGASIVLVDCEVDNNGGYGVGVNSLVGRGFGQLYSCSIHHNDSGGLQDGTYKTIVINCAIYRNGGDGLVLSSNPYSVTLIGNTIFSNSGNGITLNSSDYGAHLIRNNVIKDSGAYGIDKNGVPDSIIFEDYNCFHDNTSGALDTGSIGANSITSDPKFTSETDGSEDFTPQSSSPLLGAGIDGGQW